jgi:hypothetical protein
LSNPSFEESLGGDGFDVADFVRTPREFPAAKFELALDVDAEIDGDKFDDGAPQTIPLVAGVNVARTTPYCR